MNRAKNKRLTRNALESKWSDTPHRKPRFQLLLRWRWLSCCFMPGFSRQVPLSEKANIKNAVKIGKTKIPWRTVGWANLCVRVSYEGRVTVFEGLSGFPLLSLNPLRPCVLGGVVRSTKYPKALRRTDVDDPRTLRFRQSCGGTP